MTQFLIVHSKYVTVYFKERIKTLVIIEISVTEIDKKSSDWDAFSSRTCSVSNGNCKLFAGTKLIQSGMSINGDSMSCRVTVAVIEALWEKN